MKLIQMFGDDTERFNKYLDDFMAIDAKREHMGFGKRIYTFKHICLVYKYGSVIDSILTRMAEAEGKTYSHKIYKTMSFAANGYNLDINKGLEEYEYILVEIYEPDKSGAVTIDFYVKKKVAQKMMVAYNKYLNATEKK